MNVSLSILLIAMVIGIFTASLAYVNKNYNHTDLDAETRCYVKSGKYHAYDCKTIKGKSTNDMPLYAAIRNGYSPCSKCQLVSNDNDVIKNTQRMALLPSAAAIVAFVCVFKYTNKL